MLQTYREKSLLFGEGDQLETVCDETGNFCDEKWFSGKKNKQLAENVAVPWYRNTLQTAIQRSV